MAFPTRPTDDPEWAEDSAALVDEPENERARGFPFQYVPPADQVNWLQRMVGRWIDYFRRSAGGGFDSLTDLIDTLEPGECAMLATPDLRPGDEIGRVEIPREIFAIATDGKSVYYVEEKGLARYEPDTDLLFGPASLPDIDTTEEIFLECNGDAVAVAYTSDDTPAQGRVRVYDADLSVRWAETYDADPDTTKIAGMALAGSSLYISTIDSSRGVLTIRLDIDDGTELSTTPDSIVRATNGRYVATVAHSGAAWDLTLREPDLTAIWTYTTNFDQSADVPRVTMDAEKIYTSGDDAGGDDLHVYLAADMSFGLLLDSSDSVSDARKIAIDTEHLFAASGTYDKRRIAVDSPLLLGIDDIGSQYIEVASDSARVYLAGETTTAGTYAIWVLAKGQPPKIWRRLDPTDDDAWPRTLAAPI